MQGRSTVPPVVAVSTMIYPDVCCTKEGRVSLKEISFIPFPTLQTERLTLRQLSIRDAIELLFLRSDEEVMKYIDNPRLTSVEEAKAKLIWLNDGVSSGKWVIWGIAPIDGNAILGTICLWNMELDRAKAEIGYDLLPCHQRKGIMNEAMQAVLAYAFQDLQLCVIVACPNRFNARSIKLLEKNGFTLSQDTITSASADHYAPDTVYIHWNTENEQSKN
jgi:[ribosomal protein S5]-alanine N-acetyltransferase